MPLLRKNGRSGLNAAVTVFYKYRIGGIIMKTALLVVSFGTTHLDTFQKTIAATEKAIAKAFPEYPFYRAFVSKIVRFRLKEEFDMAIDNVEEALARIATDGFTHVLLQPTLLIPGEEFDRLKASVQSAKGRLQVVVGEPLLCGEADMESMLCVLEKTYPIDEETVLLLMGHGTEHSGNAIYEQMVQKMRWHTGSAMRLCTVEGTPSFGDAVQELTAMSQRKATVAPLLFVAGDHAKNDMAGETADSLRSMLEARGFCADCKLQGLGEISAVQQMYVEKAKAAEKRL